MSFYPVNVRQKSGFLFPEVSVYLRLMVLLKTLLLEESAASYDAVATLTGVDEENYHHL